MDGSEGPRPPPRPRFECENCRRVFRDGFNLRQHAARRRPCAPAAEEEGPPLGCSFCGQAFSREDALKRHQQKSCRALRDECVLRRRVGDLEAERAAERRRVDALEARLAALADAHQADRRTPTAVYNTSLVVNFFGREDTARIPAERVRQILRESSAPTGAESSLRASAVRAICEAACLIYSDPSRPENITCFIPNKRERAALVHGDGGWQTLPASLVLTPMARASVDLLFGKQPLEEGAKQCEALLAHLRDSERELSAEGSECDAPLRTILIRNKDLLARALAALPAAGDE